MTLHLDHNGKLTAKRNKYGVAPKCERTADGITFDSRRECEVYGVLKLLRDRREISELELQPKFPMPIGITYVADFRFLDHGIRRVVDVKGLETPEFKLKAKCLRYFYPHVVLEIWK